MKLLELLTDNQKGLLKMLEGVGQPLQEESCTLMKGRYRNVYKIVFSSNSEHIYQDDSESPQIRVTFTIPA